MRKFSVNSDASAKDNEPLKGLRKRAIRYLAFGSKSAFLNTLFFGGKRGTVGDWQLERCSSLLSEPSAIADARTAHRLQPMTSIKSMGDCGGKSLYKLGFRGKEEKKSDLCQHGLLGRS